MPGSVTGIHLLVINSEGSVTGSSSPQIKLVLNRLKNLPCQSTLYLRGDEPRGRGKGGEGNMLMAERH